MELFRSFERVIKARIDENDPLIQVVIGPRQVGKTTAIKQALNGRGLYVTADSPSPLRPEDIERWWHEAGQSQTPILAIDEIQKISGWSETIKKLWESARPKNFKLILSGSAALAIEKNLRESLAGRYELIRAEHWNLAEAREIFGLDRHKFISMGCYPGSMKFANDLERWGSYLRDSIIEPVIGRDILQLHPVQQPALLRQLFGLASALPAQILSYNKMQGQLQDRGAVITLSHYLELLSHGFLVSGLEKFSTKTIRAKRSSPKLIVHDNGLLRALERPISTPIVGERLGRYFENAVGARFVEAGWETYYWSERHLEVDFVVLGPGGERFAVEVKSSHTSQKDLRGVIEFCKRHKDFEPRLVSLIDQSVPGIENWNTDDVLSLQR